MGISVPQRWLCQENTPPGTPQGNPFNSTQREAPPVSITVVYYYSRVYTYLYFIEFILRASSNPALAFIVV